jgi:hypothetical protein
MKNSSRRAFGKQLTGAVAALPLVLATKTAALTDNAQRKRADIRSHQDTPPPIIIEEGSIKLDVFNQNLGSGPSGPILPAHPSGGYRWEFPKTHPANDIFLVGMKIVSGEERLLFYMDRDFAEADRNQISVRIHTEGPVNARQELVLSTEGRYVTFKVPPQRELKTPATPETPTLDRWRFRYHDQNGHTNYPILSVAIATGPTQQTVLARIDPPRLPEGPSELKILLWFEDITTRRT